jgi:hypothetical protein
MSFLTGTRLDLDVTVRIERAADDRPGHLTIAA